MEHDQPQNRLKGLVWATGGLQSGLFGFIWVIYLWVVGYLPTRYISA